MFGMPALFFSPLISGERGEERNGGRQTARRKKASSGYRNERLGEGSDSSAISKE